MAHGRTHVLQVLPTPWQLQSNCIPSVHSSMSNTLSMMSTAAAAHSHEPHLTLRHDSVLKSMCCI
jgi:hypothetical protein